MKKIALMAVMGVLLASPAAFAEETAGGFGGGAAGGGAGGKMKALDTDGDGNISKAEFQAMGEKHFARMDKNGDGVISADERPDMSKMKGRRGGAGGGLRGGGEGGMPPADGVPNIPAE